MPYKGMLIGQKTTAGTVAALTPKRVTSAAQAAKYFGAGSSLHRMALAWFANNTFSELWAVAFDDPGAGAAAVGSVTFGGTITESGTLALYLGGARVQVGITAGMSAASVATAAVAAINADTSLPVTAAVDGVTTSKINITHKHKGSFGNDFDIRTNYFDTSEALPAGMTTTIVQLVGGTGAPVFSTLWPVLGDSHFNIWAMPYNDTASLSDLKVELVSRSGPLRQIDAVAFIAKPGSFSTVTTFGEGQNAQFVSCEGTQQSPTPAMEVAAENAAIVASYGQRDPARPFQTLVKAWMKSPKLTDRFSQAERNLCLYSGISMSRVTADGSMAIDRVITMYQTNSFGADDTAYLDVNTILTLSYLRYDFRNYILRKYPRHKLANDGTRFGAGQAVVTPKIIKAECLVKFREWELIGLVENIDQFKRDLMVFRNVQDPNRIDIYLPPDLVNQLRITAVQVGFRLQTVEIAE